jgi:hypothetical protein
MLQLQQREQEMRDINGGGWGAEGEGGNQAKGRCGSTSRTELQVGQPGLRGSGLNMYL